MKVSLLLILLDEIILILNCRSDEERHESKLSSTKENSQLRTYLNEDIGKNIVWALSKLSYSFIKFKKPETEAKKNDAKVNLLKSQLLSGGIENRFINTFSKKTLKIIESLATVAGDKQIHDYLGATEQTDEDDILQAIIHQDKNRTVDLLIDVLDWSLKRTKPMAWVRGEKGIILARCAFAATLCLNQHEEECSYTNLAMMIDHLEVVEPDLDSTLNDNQRLKQLSEELKSLGSYEPFLLRWESASKMRKWLKDKQTEISNSIQRQADSERLKKQEEAKLKQEGEQTDDREETKTQVTDKTEDLEIPKADPEELKKRENDQIDILVKRVCQKAELLLKLATPSAWSEPDRADSLIMLANAPTHKESNVGDSFAQALKKIRHIQASKATILNYENVSDKEIFKSCVSSVLSCLQCSVTAEEIQENLESQFVNAMHRWCGLKIMAELTSCYLPKDSMISCLNAFCSSLRQNKNILAHYSDDLKGMGEYLQNKCRISFFDVYNNISKQLRSSTETETIEFLLNCLKWRIGASDHQFVLKSGVIHALKEGNGKDNKDENPIKYRYDT